MEVFVNSSALLLVLACSLIYCFFGYRFFKSLLSLAGALILGSAAWALSIKYFDSNLAIVLPIALVSALLGAWLFHKLFKIAAFLYGAAAGFALSPSILSLVETDLDWVKWAIPLACALTGGFLLLISQRIVLIVMTAASGALYFVHALSLLLVQWHVQEDSILDQPDKVQLSISLFCFVLTFISGLVFQLKDKKTITGD